MIARLWYWLAQWFGAIPSVEDVSAPPEKCKRPEWHDGPCGEIQPEDVEETR